MLFMLAIRAKLNKAFDLLYYWGMIYIAILFVYIKAYKNNMYKY